MNEADLAVKPAQHTTLDGMGQPSDLANVTMWSRMAPWLALVAWLLLLLIHLALWRWRVTDRQWADLVGLLMMSWVGVKISIGGWLAAWAILSEDRILARLIYGLGGAIASSLIIAGKNNWRSFSYLEMLEPLDVAVCTAVVAFILCRRDFRLTATHLSSAGRLQKYTTQFSILDVFVLTTGIACLLGIQLVPRPGLSDRWFEITLAILVTLTLLVGLATTRLVRFTLAAVLLAISLGTIFWMKYGGGRGIPIFAFGSILFSVSWLLIFLWLLRWSGYRLSEKSTCEAG